MLIERSQFPFKEYGDEIKAMFHRHWDEVGMKGAPDLALDINEAYYHALEQTDTHLTYVLKTDEGKLAGYLSIFLYGHPHHSNINFAAVDCFIVDKPYRNTSGFKTIIKMFRLAEKELKEKFNCQYFQFAFSCNNPLASLAKRLGFVESDVLYVKGLGR